MQELRAFSRGAFASVSTWVADLEHVHTSYLLLGILGAGMLAAGVLFHIGLIGWVLRCFGRATAASIRGGFRTWEHLFGRASWEQFLAVVLGFLFVGVLAGGWLPPLRLVCGAVLMTMGSAACMAYMFIDLERNEVERGYKSIHTPLKGQTPAESLKRYGKQVGIPLLIAASGAAIGGFALFNQGLYETVGKSWYAVADAPRPPVFADFLAFAITRVLNLVDVLDLAKSHHILGSESVTPAKWPAAALAGGFKVFFTVVLLHQVFASLRQGKLLAETIADFWSPHEPIHQRARNALPVFGVVAIDPLLRSLRSVASLTKEQRDQLPLVLETMGPSIIPALGRHLGDSHEHVRAISASALGKLHATDALPSLVALVEDESEIVRQGAVEALGLLGEHQPAVSRKPIARPRRGGFGALGLARWLARRRGVEATTPTPENAMERIVTALDSALDDESTTVRLEAVTAIGRIGREAARVAPKLIALSKDGDDTLRCQAARALGEVGGDAGAVLAALVDLLDDAGPDVRAAAAGAIGRLGPAAAPAVPALAPLLQDREESVRTAAAEAIAQAGPLEQAAAEALAEGLASEDTVVRAQTAQALGTIGAAAEEAAPALAEAMEDENDRVRAEAVEAIGKIGEPAAEAAVPGLIRALEDDDAEVGARAAEALGLMGGAAGEAAPALVAALSHPNPSVRLNAARALGRLGSNGSDVRRTLEATARDEDGGVRAEAVLALGRLGEPTADSMDRIVEALGDEDPQVRAAAVTSAGRWGAASESILDRLGDLLDDPSDQVKLEATRVLPGLAGATPGVVEGLCRQLLEDDSAPVQAHAALALGKLGDSAAGAGDALLQAARTGEATVREQAMRALAMIQPPEAAEAFTDGLKDASVDVRILASAGWLKAEVVPDRAAPALIEALRDPEVRVRANAASALARLDAVPAEAVPLLVDAASDPNDALRLGAVQALKKAPPGVVAEVMSRLTADPNARVRLAAAATLLAREADNAEAAAVLLEALAHRSPGVREEAFSVFESLGEDCETVLDAVQVNALPEPAPEATEVS